MAEIRDIATGKIDPESTVNVRRSQVKEAVERVKLSIAEHGFWKNNPITVRPHPDSTCEYAYEVVTGQCRLRACLELGIAQIPAVVQEIEDDAAIRESWAENEGRSDIPRSDKAYWVHRIITKYTKEGKSLTDSREIAAKFFAISVQSVINYHPLVVLPPEVSKLMDDSRLSLSHARAIAKSSYDPSNPEASEQAMRERAEWIMSLDRDEQKVADDVLERLGPKASIDELTGAVGEGASAQKAILEVSIPESLRGKLVQWGEERGLTDEAMIITHMIAEVLRGA